MDHISALESILKRLADLAEEARPHAAQCHTAKAQDIGCEINALAENLGWDLHDERQVVEASELEAA
jgi:hypothetical protein